MTDPTHHPSPDEHDELASAHLDGETSPAEAARVEGNPALRAQVARFERVRAAVRGPDHPIDDVRRDAAIAAALAVARTEAEAEDVVLLDAARARRRRRAWQVRLVGAAAVLALALTAVAPRLVGDDGDGGPDVVASAPEADERAEDRASPMAEGEAGGSAPSSHGAGVMAVPLLSSADASDLGTVTDLAALAERVSAALTGRATFAPATPPADPLPVDACLARLQADAGHAVLLVALATVGERPVVAVVVAEPEGTRRLEVAALDGCEPVGTVPV